MDGSATERLPTGHRMRPTQAPTQLKIYCSADPSSKGVWNLTSRAPGGCTESVPEEASCLPSCGRHVPSRARHLRGSHTCHEEHSWQLQYATHRTARSVESAPTTQGPARWNNTAMHAISYTRSHEGIHCHSRGTRECTAICSCSTAICSC